LAFFRCRHDGRRETGVERFVYLTPTRFASVLADRPMHREEDSREMSVQLAAGTWPDGLAKLAAPCREGFAALLVAGARVDGEHVGEKLESHRARIDEAALTLSRRIEAAAHRRGAREPALPTPAPARKADKALAELARLGVAPP
jgi:hypothetical protein